MSELLDNLQNLKIIEYLVSGEAVNVNYSHLSRELSKSRDLLHRRVNNLVTNGIIEPPHFPFNYIFEAFPLFLIINMDIPDCFDCKPKIMQWLRDDPKVFAAYKFRQGEFGTLIFTFHEDLKSSHEWMAQIPFTLEEDYHVAKEHASFNSNTIYLSNQLLMKYNPCTGFNVIEKDFKKEGKISFNGYELDTLDLSIMQNLIDGKSINYNHNIISNQTGLDYRTVEKRVESFIKNKILMNPTCTFPNLFTPPNYFLSYMLARLEYPSDPCLRNLLSDEKIPVLWKTIQSKYNILLFYIHRNVRDLYVYSDDVTCKVLENAQKKYLAHEPIARFDDKKISLHYIQQKINSISNKTMYT